jgi:hypothetical protein
VPQPASRRGGLSGDLIAASYSWLADHEKPEFLDEESNHARSRDHVSRKLKEMKDIRGDEQHASVLQMMISHQGSGIFQEKFSWRSVGGNGLYCEWS